MYRARKIEIAALLWAALVVLSLPGAYAWELLASDSNTVKRFSEAGSDLGDFTFGVSPGGAMDIALGGSKGDLYVAAQSAGKLIRYNGAAGAYLASAALNMPAGVAFDSTGRLYVSCRGSTGGIVKRWNDPTDLTSSQVFVAEGSGGMVEPGDIAFGPDGRLYVLGGGSSRAIYVYNGTTGAYIYRRDPGTSLGGLAFKDGYLYYSEYWGNNVWRIPLAQLQSGAFTKFVDNGGGGPADGLLGLAFGPDGNLYVASNQNGRILRYNGSTGAYIDTFASVASPRFLGFLNPPSSTAGVGPGARILITKCYPSNPTAADFQQVANAGFTFAVKDTDMLDPCNNSGSLVYMQSYFNLAAGKGLKSGVWQGGMAPARLAEAPRVHRDGSVSTYATPASSAGWQALGTSIVQYAELSLTHPNNKFLVLDYEPYDGHGGDCSESYDDYAFVNFFQATGRPVPNPLPALNARYSYIVGQGLLNEYINHQWNIVYDEMRIIRQRIDAVNPAYQIGVYFGGSLLSAIKQGVTTEAAPVLDMDVAAFARGPFDPAWDPTPEGGYGGSANRPDRLGLKWSLTTVSSVCRRIRQIGYPTIALAGHWMQAPGPADGSHYKFLTRQAFNSVVYGDGYWIWTDAFLRPPWTSMTDWINAMMSYFAQSKAALAIGDHAWASRQPNPIPDPNGTVPVPIYTIAGDTAKVWDPITGLQTGTRSASGLTPSSYAIGDVDAVPGNEVVTLRNGLIQIWDPASGSELLRFPVGVDQTGVALPDVPPPSSWLLVSNGAEGTVKKFSEAGAYLGAFTSGGPTVEYAYDLGYGKDGCLYLIDAAAGALLRYNATTGAYMNTVASGIKDPAGFACDSNGYLYVSHRSTGSDWGVITRFDPASPGTSTTFVTAGDHGLLAPSDIDFGPDGNLYVAAEDAWNSNQPSIFVYSPSGAFLRKRAPGVRTLSVAFYNDYIYWSDYWAGNVWRLRLNELTTGTPESFLSGYGTMITTGIDFGPDGKLYVCTVYNNKIIGFNGMTGAYESEFISVSNPRCLLFGDAPPEPDTSINAAKNAAAGSPVEIRNVIATAQFFTGSGTPNSFAVQNAERTAGIRVLSSTQVMPGDRLTIAGSAFLLGGERVIDARTGAVTIQSSGQPCPGPLAMANRATGGGAHGAQPAVVDDATATPVKMSAGRNSIGLLVTIAGTVTAAVNTGDWSGYFYVDDGSGLRDGSGRTGIRCRPAADVNGLPQAMPAIGSYVVVTGVLGVPVINGRNVRQMWTRSVSTLGAY